ncbi:hypothetical protein KO498_09950 [Lentibacter algarum]|uniref:hypothetical protein n=1 Tax=Lentibacter algarum TaxID=576131 RepID=UPI001C07365C|nr:hypothetical protein [Lentibacter algarum]MBU2982134.1 hypothetical protein [Lentibacter algarum]
METLVWIGAALTVAGVVGLFWCILKVNSARREKLPDDALRARVQAILPWNLGALGLSALGLGCVVAGIMLA